MSKIHTPIDDLEKHVADKISITPEEKDTWTLLRRRMAMRAIYHLYFRSSDLVGEKFRVIIPTVRMDFKVCINIGTNTGFFETLTGNAPTPFRYEIS